MPESLFLFGADFLEIAKVEVMMEGIPRAGFQKMERCHACADRRPICP